jgi:hypothetical protein
MKRRVESEQKYALSSKIAPCPKPIPKCDEPQSIGAANERCLGRSSETAICGPEASQGERGAQGKKMPKASSRVSKMRDLQGNPKQVWQTCRQNIQ